MDELKLKAELFDKIKDHIKIMKQGEVESIVLGYDGIGFVINKVFGDKIEKALDYIREN